MSISFIGIDIGSSFIKGAILDLDTVSLRQVYREPFPGRLRTLPSVYYEVNPNRIVAAARKMIYTLLDLAPNCAGIVMCGQGSSLVLCNEYGQPLSNCITWKDERILFEHPSGQGSYLDVLLQRANSIGIEPLGNELRSGSPMCALFWLAERNELPGKHIIPCSVHDFVCANLCKSYPCAELTSAGTYGALNLDSLDWYHSLIVELGLEDLDWPKLCGLGNVVGYFKTRNKSLPCYTPVADQQCALLGVTLRRRELSINASTGSQISLLASKVEYGDYQVRPYFDGQFIKTITRIPAGRSLDALVRLLCEITESEQGKIKDAWLYIGKAVESTKEVDLIVNLAFFSSGFGDRGGISNIKEKDLTVGAVFKAAFINMANNYYEAGLRLSRNQGWDSLVFSGGLVQRIAALREIISQKFHTEYRLAFSSEDTLLGLLVLALVFSKRATSIEQAIEMLPR